MTSLLADLPVLCLLRRPALFALLLLGLLLLGCNGQGNGDQEGLVAGSPGAVEPTRAPATKEPPAPALDLVLAEEDVSLEPLPLRAGFPFTVTALIHNDSAIPAVDVPFIVHIAAEREEIGYSSFLQVVTATLPASQSVAVEVPVSWNFAGGEHQLWVQVNRLPNAWAARLSTQPEADIANNIVFLDLIVDPFDSYSSDLCSGRVDVEIGPTDIVTDPRRQSVRVRVHNTGNQAVYNLPVVVTGDQLSGITYTPAIPPCGGTADVLVSVDRPFQAGESLRVQVNPSEWEGGLQEDSLDNNWVAVTARLPAAGGLPTGESAEDYDFSLTTADIETPEMWTVLVTVHNLGTRDAAMVPLRVENQAGRKIVDAIPYVQGEGVGMAAIRVGYLWTAGSTLTFTVNPADAKGAYSETDRENNVATFTLP